jgi:hypothetical protein
MLSDVAIFMWLGGVPTGTVNEGLFMPTGSFESKWASGVTKKETPPTSGGFVVENFALLPHRAEAPYHRALQVGWSRFRAVLMLV